MTGKKTGEKAEHIFLKGDKLYQERARQAFPILVRQAKAQKEIYYSDLAEELGMPNPRNLNYVLGTIGNAMMQLGEKWDEEVPPIQSVVVNKSKGLPGEGFEWFVPNKKDYEKASPSRKRQIMKEMLHKSFSYDYWDDVLEEFSLPPSTNLVVSTKKNKSNPPSFGGSGESDAHKNLKQFVANNPQVVGLPSNVAADEEYSFWSADSVDVLFRQNDSWIGVEVKSIKSNDDDLRRGLFQCVKYKALIEATQMAQQIPIDAESLLVFEGFFPQSLIGLKNTLGIKVIDEVEVPK